MRPDDARAEVAAAVRANYEAQRDARVAGDADKLGELLTDGFTLTHMTGYRQPKAEWLADVRSGAMTYHTIEDVDVTVEPDNVTPVVTARTRTEATIWGSNGTGHSGCASGSPVSAAPGSPPTRWRRHGDDAAAG
jgi:hypothetical protein